MPMSVLPKLSAILSKVLRRNKQMKQFTTNVHDGKLMMKKCNFINIAWQISSLYLRLYINTLKQLVTLSILLCSITYFHFILIYFGDFSSIGSNHSNAILLYICKYLNTSLEM